MAELKQLRGSDAYIKLFLTHTRQLVERLQQIQESARVPHRDQVVYSGTSGKFYMGSMSDLAHISPQSLASNDAELKGLGFTQVFDGPVRQIN